MTGKLTQADKDAAVRSTRRFDLRRILGALFVVYGAILTIVGIVDLGSDAVGKQTGGLAVNLWTGIAMLVLGGLFFLWDRLAPVPAEDIIANLERQDEERRAGEGRG
ncbi:MAG: hypothetical protein JWP32_2637 [Schumannella sp.]|jgi:hypothetical protein|nr:hypothetical protein [Schumannella sp.]